MPEERDIKPAIGYWKEVRGRAWQSAWKDAGMKTKTLTTFFLLLLAGLSGLFTHFSGFSYPFLTTQITAAAAGLSTFWVSFLTFIVLLFVALIRIPPVMDQEKKDEIDSGKQRIVALEEDAKPKLELLYDENDEGRCQVWGDGFHVYRITVRNTGNKLIPNARVVLVKISPEAPSSEGIKLHFRHDPDDPPSDIPHSINANDAMLVDIIRVKAARDVFPAEMFFYAEMEALRFPCDLRDYVLTVSVSGDGSPRRDERFKFIVNPPGSVQPFAFQQLPHEAG